MQLNNIQFFAWTDSTIVLAWLKGHPSKWKTFVANRVAEIHSSTIQIHWNHVKTSDNPADYASRGIAPTKLVNLELWWNGPKWLTGQIIASPRNCNMETEVESRQTCAHFASSNNLEAEFTLLTRYSSLRRLTRILAYCRRFILNTRTVKANRVSGSLQPHEIEEATKTLIRITQQHAFCKEIHQLKKEDNLMCSSKLTPLDPIIDEDGILRVGGRLHNSDLSFEEKHPIILPHDSSLTTLVIDAAHQTTLHGGCKLTLSHIRQTYWIIRGYSAVKQRLHRCIRCHRFRAKSRNQLMGILPRPRVIAARPFLNSGVDYAGPIEIRSSKGRGQKTYKGYIVLFVCLATKAVHIEIASDLTAQSFLAAFKRFVGRRGNIENLYSDNATNFTFANKILLKDKEEYIRTFSNPVIQELTSVGTHWHFIPPSSPHFGGLWEAGVKSIKYHLKRTIGDTKLTYEELSTVAVQIEACLNSRPLCPITEDPHDLDILTPGHFLIGNPLLAPPTRNLLDRNINLLTRWELLDRMQQEFWRKWSMEYLTRLQQRPKWTRRSRNLKIGDLVLIKNEQSPPTRWPLGRITETHTGQDGLVRVVTLRTEKGTLKRPIQKISLLPITDNDCLPNATTEENPSTISNLHTCTGEVEILQHIQEQRSSTSSTSDNSIPEDEHLKLHTKRKTKAFEWKAINYTRLHRRQSVHPYTWWIVILLFFIFPIAMGENTAPVIVTPFTNHPGIYFEDIGEVKLSHHEWNLVVYYDLHNYWQEIQGIRSCIQKLADLCSRVIEKRNYCLLVSEQFEEQLKGMEYVNEVLQNQGGFNMQKRKQKRSPFDIIGTAANKLFGILDQEFAQHYEEQIEKIRSNEEHLLHLLKNQTSIIEATTNILGKNEEAIRRQFKHVEEAISQEAQEIKVTQAFTTITVYTTLIMMSYQKIQGMLLDVITDTHHGKINSLLLTPRQLKSQLELMREHIHEAQEIPGKNGRDILQIYKLMTVKGRITVRYALFDIRLPLLDKETYQLFKVVPVPTRHEDKYILIEPATDYLAITLHRDHYYPMFNTDLQACSTIEVGRYICVKKHPVFNTASNNSKCEVDLLNHKEPFSSFCNVKTTEVSNFWVQLHHPDNWIFALDGEHMLNIVCNNKLIVTKLTGEGMIKLRPDCIIKQSTMTITSRATYPNVFNSSFSPSANLSQHLKGNRSERTGTSKTEQLLGPADNQLKDIKETIKGLQAQEILPQQLNTHDIHHYSISYVMLAAIISGISYIVFRKLKRDRTSTNNTPRQQRPIPAKRTKSLHSEDFVLDINPRREDVGDQQE